MHKDEFEVARLLTDPQFLDQVRSEVTGGEKLIYMMHRRSCE